MGLQADLDNNSRLGGPKAIMGSAYILLFCSMMLIIMVSSIGPFPGTAGSSNMFVRSANGGDNHEDQTKIIALKPESANLKHRKLLVHGTCTNRDISISQSTYSSTGIPQYIVEIVSTCLSGCAPSSLHVHCGWFASARMVNPRTFRRLSYDDCLVNAGKPLKTSEVIRFTYSNTFMYPLSFKSAKFC